MAVRGKQSIEAFSKYFQSKETMSELTQIGTAAFNLLGLNVSVDNGSTLLGAFVDSCQIAHWGKGKNFPNPVLKTSQIKELFCRHILVQQVSAFDIFSKSIVCDLAKFSSSGRKNLSEISHQHSLLVLSPQNRWVASSCCNEIKNKVGKLVNRVSDLERIVGWTPAEKIAKIMPLFDLARMARNRVVHSDSIVGSELEEFSQSKHVRDAFNYFSKHFSSAPPPGLPKWDRGHILTVSPANAIFFGAVLLEIAKDINRHVCTLLNQDDFLQMAFFYGCFVETHPFRTKRMRDPEGRILSFLNERYFCEASPKSRDVPSLMTQHRCAGAPAESDTTLWKIAINRHKELVDYEKNNLPAYASKRDITEAKSKAKEEQSRKEQIKISRKKKKSGHGK